LPQQQQPTVGTDVAAIKADIDFAPSEFRNGTWAAVQFGIGGISTAIS
jgi:hypothetical protein